MELQYNYDYEKQQIFWKTTAQKLFKALKIKNKISALLWQIMNKIRKVFGDKRKPFT